jgi:hypothetical protein
MAQGDYFKDDEYKEEKQKREEANTEKISQMAKRL